MIFAIPFLLLTAAEAKPPLQVVPSVDFNRYAGKWYEIARFPNRFQRDCASNTAATYSLMPHTFSEADLSGYRDGLYLL